MSNLRRSRALAIGRLAASMAMLQVRPACYSAAVAYPSQGVACVTRHACAWRAFAVALDPDIEDRHGRLGGDCGCRSFVCDMARVDANRYNSRRKGTNNGKHLDRQARQPANSVLWR